MKIRSNLAAVLMLLFVAGCSNSNLGDIDETMTERDDMSGPGVFAKDDGKPALSWSTGDDESTAVTTQAASTTTTTDAATLTATSTAAAESSAATDKAEFEQFKAWNEMREQGNNSADYREFQQWLEYQQFKAAE